jgi:uncharacterized protein YlaI
MASCSSHKVGYATHELAKHALYHSQSVAKKGQTYPIRVYYCHECERFHLSSEEKENIRDFIYFIMRIL